MVVGYVPQSEISFTSGLYHQKCHAIELWEWYPLVVFQDPLNDSIRRIDCMLRSCGYVTRVRREILFHGSGPFTAYRHKITDI